MNGFEPWEPIAPLQTARACPAAASNGRGNIIVSGGGESIYRHAEVYKTAEIMLYSASEQQRDVEWLPFPEMGEARCAHGLALGDSGYLYACGGYGGGTTYLNTIEYIDAHRPDERGWRPCGSLERARAFGACCTGPDHCLYILGGTDNGSTGFSSCLKWDPRSATSHHLAPMSSSRHAFAASFAPDGKLYVAGGFEYVGTPLRSAECYEPVADKWRQLPELGASMEFCSGVCVW